MKILTAAPALVPRDTDFCHALVGEICVPHTIICTNPEKRALCGCDREHLGITTGGATTTVRVSETELTVEELADTCRRNLLEGDWDRLFGQDGIAEAAENLVAQSVEVAEDHPLGMILRPRYDDKHELWFYDEADG